MLDFETLTHKVENMLEMIGVGIDVLGVCVICIGIVGAFWKYFRSKAPAPSQHGASPYRVLKIDIGLVLLLGLEVLVAADIVKTVAVELTFNTMGVLGLLVIIRTFLSWALVLEIEGRWPWQGEEQKGGVKEV
ncbi:MAG: DUF1622 domain-containing protein [Chloroflexaceae bacterium]|nr:DUF1622 domain-containing protein [bacterium]NJO06964.1 DUF1622 domain-containing protein [Chloroflexaceae bacterium]